MALKPKGLMLAAGLAVVAFGVSAGAMFAQQAPAQQAVPEAKIEIVAIPANAANPDAFMGTLPSTGAKVAMGTTGLENVSVGVPEVLQGSAVDPKAKVTKFAWTLSGPTASKSKLDATDQAKVKFTPDVAGIYKVDLTVTTAGGTSEISSVQIHAGEYVGAGTGNCFQCHPQKTQEWSETPHAKIFTQEINGGAEPAISHYNEGCLRCHNTGYYLGVANGGFADVQAKTGWKFPALEAIQTGKGQWEAAPLALQNMGNIQCEDCHGPAKDHVTKGGSMATSLDEGVCNICHNGGGHHIKGMEFQNSAHSHSDAQAWTYPVGPSRQDCVRCHSGKGFISFLANPTNVASWNNEAQNATCGVCHDPHSDANKFQLRITGKPVVVPGVSKDFGLSTVCAECHNARTTASVDAANGVFPHYSAAAEMLADTGGVTYGRTVPNSAHGMVVGEFPVVNSDPAASGALLFAGNVPGPCVACHMTVTPANPKDPEQYHIGEHSFNTKDPTTGFNYTESCKPCHEGINVFNFPAKYDYDGNGKVEGVQTEVQGLMTALQGAINKSGIKTVQGYPYFDQSGKASWTLAQKNAMYNYLFVRGIEGTNGVASAIHNFKRSVALLQYSYKDLTGQNVPGATLVQ